MGSRVAKLYEGRERKSFAEQPQLVREQVSRFEAFCRTAARSQPLNDLGSDDDGYELLKDDLLRSGEILLLVGGDSSATAELAAQVSLNCSLGRDSFGFRPTGRLRVLTLSATMTAREMAKNRDAVFRESGRSWESLSIEKQAEYGEGFFHVYEPKLTGWGFVRDCLFAQICQRSPHLIVLHNFLDFMDTQPEDHAGMLEFLRLLQAMLLHSRAAAITTTHAGKSEPLHRHSAHGSCVQGHLAAEVLTLRNVRDQHEVRAWKRPERLGWTETDENMRPTAVQTLVRSAGLWRQQAPGRELREFVALVSADQQIPLADFRSLASASGIAHKKIDKLRKLARRNSLLREINRPRHGCRPEILIARA